VAVLTALSEATHKSPAMQLIKELPLSSYEGSKGRRVRFHMLQQRILCEISHWS